MKSQGSSGIWTRDYPIVRRLLWATRPVTDMSHLLACHTYWHVIRKVTLNTVKHISQMWHSLTYKCWLEAAVETVLYKSNHQRGGRGGGQNKRKTMYYLYELFSCPAASKSTWNELGVVDISLFLFNLWGGGGGEGGGGEGGGRGGWGD